MTIKRNIDRITIVTGAFDPISIDDLLKLRTAKKNSNWLIVGVHSDNWVLHNTNALFNPYEDRRFVIENIKAVDEVFGYDDMANNDVQLVKAVRACYPGAEIVYVSDKPNQESPEARLKGVKLAYIK
jgi:glycerol-3-phosphate cytidylyltransferase-like family protein